MSIFKNYEPQKVLYYFEKISSIPRDSLKEDKVADYFVEFAKERNLEWYRDNSHNVVIKKPATVGYETCDTVILQGHSDMVCLSEEGYEHDFDNEGLELYIDNGLIRAKGTTLGADDGIALAYGLAMLDREDIPHPSLEVVFTTAEEIGMVGAKNFDMSVLKGKKMISFDSGGFTEGRIYVGCAGGERVTLTQTLNYKQSSIEGNIFEISISGLKGGHAGGEISKGKANASILLGRLLSLMEKAMDFELIRIQGGDGKSPVKHSIPEKSSVIVKVADKMILENFVADFLKTIKEDFDNVEDAIEIVVEENDKYNESLVFDDKTQEDIIDIIVILPNGVLSMHKYFVDTPECSNNLGNIDEEGGKLIYHISIRSSKDSLIDVIGEKLERIGRIKGLEAERTGRLSGWEYEPNSRLKDLIEKEYIAMYGEKPRFKITHASTECGLFKRGVKDLEVMSIGPIIYDEHTPKEYMEIVSVNELWKFLCKVLKEMKNI